MFPFSRRWPFLVACLSLASCQMAPPQKYEEYKTTEKTTTSTVTYPKYTQEEPNKAPAHPGDAYDSDCKYDDVPFTDCDPFHLVKWRQMRLVFGGSHCESYKNETERCSPDDFPPGTKWLIEEHKKCLGELEHLKGLLSDLHHWIDVIHERGQSLFSAFNELKKHLEDVQRQIQDLHKQNHSYQVMLERLTKELEEWREKARELRTTVDTLKAKYEQLSAEHEKMKEVYAQCEANRETCMQEQKKLSQKVSSLVAGNRQLKAQLLEAERYKDLVEKAMDRIKQMQETVQRMEKDIGDTKNAVKQCRIDVLNEKSRGPDKFDKDTHVNLDMQMWIIHNQTKVESPTYPTTTTTTTTTYKTTYSTKPYKPYKPYYTTSYSKDVPA